MKTYIVDTYAWIAYFEGNKKFLSEIEQNILETPSIVLAELSKVLLVKKFDGKIIGENKCLLKLKESFLQLSFTKQWIFYHLIFKLFW